jgi:VanZ family protein
VIEPPSLATPLRAIAAWTFWAASLFALVMSLLPHPPQIVEASDKVQHMLAFAVLAGLAAVAWPRRLLAIGLGLVAFGGLIEVLQLIPGLHRDSQVADWAADVAAATAVLLLAAAIRAMPVFPRKTG